MKKINGFTETIEAVAGSPWPGRLYKGSAYALKGVSVAAKVATPAVTVGFRIVEREVGVLGHFVEKACAFGADKLAEKAEEADLTFHVR